MPSARPLARPMTARQAAGLSPLQPDDPAPAPTVKAGTSQCPAGAGYCWDCAHWVPRWSISTGWVGACFEERSPADHTCHAYGCEHWTARETP